MKLYTSVDQINKAVVDFSKKGATLQAEAHKIACSVLAQVDKHSDVRVVTAMVTNFTKACPSALRVNALREWFQEFGPIAFNAKGEVSFVRGKPTMLTQAQAEPFWTFEAKEGGDYKPVDADAAIHALIKKLQKDETKLGTDHSATIQALRIVLQARAAAAHEARPMLRLAA
jgi:hypothetical protein